MGYFFFTETEKLNNQVDHAYGPGTNVVIDNIEYERYLVTSKHIASDDVEAISVCNGQIFLQEQASNTGLLNIVFKPAENLPFTFPKIKYFIYKGIKKESLIDQDNIHLKGKGSSFLVDDIWRSFDQFNNSGTPEKTILGIHPSINILSDDFIIEDVFLSNFTNVQFWNIKGGNIIGKFDKDAIGFEIILDTPFYKPNLGLVRNSESFIISKVLDSNSTNNVFFEHWHDKEQILNFIDPCAFFGGFYNHKLGLINGVVKLDLENEDLYTNVLSKFKNRNKCYIDIRNEFNFSLNYFKNYGSAASDNTTNIQLRKENETAVNSINYYQSKWPILVLEYAVQNNQEFSIARLRLPVADNLKPLMFFEKAYVSTEQFLEEYQNESKLKPLSINGNYTEEFSFAIPIYNNALLCTYILLKYGKRLTEETLPIAFPTQIRKKDYLDCLFPLSINYNYEGSKLKTKVYDIEIYLDVSETHHYEGVFSLSIDFDLKNITILANPTLIKTKEFKRRLLSLTNSFSTSNVIEELNKIELSSDLTKSTLKISGADTDIIQFDTSMADVRGSFNIPDLRNIIGINITKTQWETIIALANDNFVQKYPTYLAVIDKEYLEDDDGKAYTSLNLAITGYKLQNENLLVNTLPADINLITYGIV